MLEHTAIESVLLQYYNVLLCCAGEREGLELDDIIDSLDNVAGRDTKHLKQFSRRT